MFARGLEIEDLRGGAEAGVQRIGILLHLFLRRVSGSRPLGLRRPGGGELHPWPRVHRKVI
eukprot:4559169-Alexandrium_andersonii.AAC.1